MPPKRKAVDATSTCLKDLVDAIPQNPTLDELTELVVRLRSIVEATETSSAKKIKIEKQDELVCSTSLVLCGCS
jgi:hypothetical protein